MSSGQHLVIAPTLNGELLVAIAALKLGKSVHRDSRSARDELQEAQTELVGERVHGHPEPLNDAMVRVILALVDRVELPVLDVHVAEAGEQQLELFRVEDEHATLRHDLREALDERGHLLLHALHEAPLDHQVDELFLVVVRYFYVLATWLQLVFHFLLVQFIKLLTATYIYTTV